MPLIALPAYFADEHICLDEPFPLTLNAKLTVTLAGTRKSLRMSAKHG